MLNDGYRFILSFSQQHKITTSPLLPHWIVPFVPYDTWLFKTYADKVAASIRVVRGVHSQWSNRLATLESVTIPTSVAWSHDGAHLALGLEDGSIDVRDAKSHVRIMFVKEQGKIRSVAFLHNKVHLASTSKSDGIRIWDVMTGTVIRSLDGHSGAVNSISVSPTDLPRLASASADTTIKIWDTSSGSSLSTLRCPASVRAVAFVSNGTQLISGSDDKVIRCWDIATESPIKVFTEHSRGIRTIAVSLDGRLFASVLKDQVSGVFNLRSNNSSPAVTLHHTARVKAVAFSPDGSHLAVCDKDGTITLWNAHDGAEISKLPYHTFTGPIAFSPDGTRLVSGKHSCYHTKCCLILLQQLLMTVACY